MRIYRDIEKAYLGFIISSDIPEKQVRYYLKWLRYYLDFCDRYGHTPSDPVSVPRFIIKLTDKHQSDFQQEQARRAVGLYHAMIAAQQAAPWRTPG
jgi:hypothetical protein